MRRIPFAKLLMALVALALAGYVAVVVTRHATRHPAAAPPPSTSAAPGSPGPHRSGPPVPFPPSGDVFLGVNTSQGPYDFGDVDRFTAATGYRPSVLQFAVGWAAHGFDRAAFDRVAGRGMLPLMSWEPWNYQETGPGSSHGVQPDYRLSRIVSGAFDDYIRTVADGIRGLDYPVAIRFAHEMNGFWYPWCEQSNGNKPGDYVQAWRHVHDIFTRAGVHNVIWVWSPNVSYAGSTPLRGLYPGDAYVDWVGLSGYYGTAGATGYVSFDGIFDATLAELRQFTSRPVVVTETGATDAIGRKADWIRQAFQQLPGHPDIIGVIWFEAVKELDWRVSSSPAASAIFRQGAAAPRYHVAWSPNSVPRTAPPAGG